MGGLVIKCFAATYPQVAASTIESWLSIAAPHRGSSAKIYMELLQVAWFAEASLVILAVPG